MDWVAINLVK